MKLELQHPSTQTTVDHFVAMAKGQTAPTSTTKWNGLGVTKQPTTYHVIPLAPPERVIAHAQTKAPSEVIRREEKKKKRKYSMPGLD